MALSVTHTFVSAIADDPTASAAGEVLPSHWNAAHTLTGQVDLTSQVTGILPAANGGTGTSTGYLPRTVNAQTGASYTILASDIGKLVTTSNAAAIATTLPQATGSFGAGSILWIENKGAGTNTITPTTSTIDGSATLALTTNQGVTLVSDGTNWTTIRGIGGAGGGTPGGSSGQLQWNSSSAFAGVSGSAVSSAGGITLANGTLTASDPILNLSQTWNNAAVAFTALKLNVTNTASAAGSLLLDLQLGSTSKFNLRVQSTFGGSFPVINNGIRDYLLGRENGGQGGFGGFYVDSDSAIGFHSGLSGLTFLYSGAANVLELRNNTNAQAFRVYNTSDQSQGGASTNYERAVFDWTTSANVLTIGTQAGGTGTTRNLKLIVGGSTVLDYGITAAGQLTVSGFFKCTQDFSLGGSQIQQSGNTRFYMNSSGLGAVAGTIQHDNGLGGIGILIHPAVTVATLPAASSTYKGGRTMVSDANATTFGSTVAGGGSNVVPVWCNGTAWVIG